MALFGSVSLSGLFSPLNTGNGSSSGGLFGSSGGSQRTNPVIRPVVGFDPNLLSASLNAQITQRSLTTLSDEDRAAINRREEAVIVPPWVAEQDSDPPLNQEIREVRGLSSFIDTNTSELEAVAGDADREATFVLFRALERLRVLAEYAGEDSTSDSSLARLDEQFQQGLAEVRDYIARTELDKLDIQLGNRTSRAETSTRLGKDETDFRGATLTATADDVLTGLTGTETFEIAVTKSGRTDTVTIDLSQVTGPLTLNNLVTYMNEQLAAPQAVDKDGQPIFDSDGQPVSQINSQFTVFTDRTRNEVGLLLDGTLTEDVRFSATDGSPTLFVAGAVEQVLDGFAVTSRIKEITDLSGNLRVSDTYSFSGIDIPETELRERTAESDTDEEPLDPAIAARRDQFLADSRREVIGEDRAAEEADAVDEDASSITNITGTSRVNADTSAARIAVDSEGSLYVVGSSAGSFDRQINVAEGEDVFLTKFDSEGNVLFSRLLGVSGDADAFAITLDSNDNVIVSGQTDSPVQQGDLLDTKDAFVAKFTARGDEVFRYQLDNFGTSSALSVTTVASSTPGADDDILVGGFTTSGINASTTFNGGRDGLLLKLDGTRGTVSQSALLGTAGNESIAGIAVADDGNILLALEEDGNAVLRKVSASDFSTEIFSLDLGSLGTDGAIQGIAVDGTSVFVSGIVQGTAPDAGGTATVNGTPAGGLDGFVTGITDSGTGATANFTTLIGTSGADRVNDILVNGTDIFVAGTTAGALGTEPQTGATDGFVARLDTTTGLVEDIEQFGELQTRSSGAGIAFGRSEGSVLSKLGLSSGTVNAAETRDIINQTSAREGDYFTLSVEGGRRVRIDIDAGDTFDDLMRKIRIGAFGQVSVSVSSTSEGDKLKIEAVRGGPAIDLLPGKGDRDALVRLGLEPGRLLPQDRIFTSLSTDESDNDDLGGAFGLGLDGVLNIRDKTTARFVQTELEDAVATIQRAFRSLEPSPLTDLFSRQSAASGPVSERTQRQIAGFQTALNRLQQINTSPSISLFG